MGMFLQQGNRNHKLTMGFKPMVSSDFENRHYAESLTDLQSQR